MTKMYQDHKEYCRPAVARGDKVDFTKEERLTKVALSGTRSGCEKNYLCEMETNLGWITKRRAYA